MKQPPSDSASATSRAIVTRGQETPFEASRQAFREKLEAARETLRARARGDVRYKPLETELGEVLAQAADFATIASITVEEAEAAQARQAGPILDGETLAPAQASVPARYLAASAQGRPKGQGELPFARPTSYVVEDKVRRLRITVTTEDLLEG